jgi:hypothetical protein
MCLRTAVAISVANFGSATARAIMTAPASCTKSATPLFFAVGRGQPGRDGVDKFEQFILVSKPRRFVSTGHFGRKTRQRTGITGAASQLLASGPVSTSGNRFNLSSTRTSTSTRTIWLRLCRAVTLRVSPIEVLGRATGVAASVENNFVTLDLKSVWHHSHNAASTPDQIE